jgi:hypothetical protein
VAVAVVSAGLAAVVASGEAAGVAVSVFCSQAASNAALANIQIYFFIILLSEQNCGSHIESKQGRFSDLLFDVDQIAGSYFNPCASATSWIVSLPSRVLIPPRKAGCFSHAPSSP